HGYLGHELLGAHTRPGRYGGSFDNRTRFLRQIVEGIRAAVPELIVGVRLSVFDLVAYRKDGHGIGEPEPGAAASDGGLGVLVGEDMDAALAEAKAVLSLLERLGVRWICVTAGSPYYCPH